ncbi:MAG TPA: transcription antitermination factor NusB [Clostridiales bacterium]|nr:transcription antitermination factor NusB [Clostridiales bacterium]
MGRRKSRDIVVKLLYQKEIVKSDIKELTDLYFQEHKVDHEDKEFVFSQIEGIEANLTVIDEEIKKHLKSWDFDRLSKPDLAILRNAVYELFYSKELSEGIIINEAVLLCKKYGSDDSFVYVNGILGNIAKSREI